MKLWPIAAGILLSGSLSINEVNAQDLPSEGWIVWASNREGGRLEIYRARADGSEVKKLTENGGTYPIWAPDGRWIEYSDETNSSWVVRPDGTDRRKLPPGWPGFWIHDNSGFVLTEPNGNVTAVDPETMEKRVLYNVSDYPQFKGFLFHPYAMTHDNRYVFVGSDLYTEGYKGTNGTFKQGYSAILLDLIDKKKMYMVGYGCWPFTPPDGDLVYHIRGTNNGDNPTWPDIYRMNLADLDTRKSYEAELANPDTDWGHEYHPRVSNDNKWLAYMASTGCHWENHCDYEIFVHRLGSGSSSRVRVTMNPSFDAFPGLYVGPLWAKSDEPQVLLSPLKLSFQAQNQTAPGPQVIKIKNGGGGQLGTATAVVDPQHRWLEVETGTGALTVKLQKGAITRGRHAAVIKLTVMGDKSGPTLIPVSLDADSTFPEAKVIAPVVDAGIVDAGMDPFFEGADATSPTVAKPKPLSSGGCAVAQIPRPGHALWPFAALWFLAAAWKRRGK